MDNRTLEHARKAHIVEATVPCGYCKELIVKEARTEGEKRALYNWIMLPYHYCPRCWDLCNPE